MSTDSIWGLFTPQKFDHEEIINIITIFLRAVQSKIVCRSSNVWRKRDRERRVDSFVRPLENLKPLDCFF